MTPAQRLSAHAAPLVERPKPYFLPFAGAFAGVPAAAAPPSGAFCWRARRWGSGSRGRSRRGGLFGGNERRHDRRNRKIPFALRWLVALGQSDRIEVNRIVNLQGDKIDNDHFGDRVRRHAHLDRVAHDV
jgi:hypothetical protein